MIEADPALIEDFRQAMRRVASTVNVISICVDGAGDGDHRDRGLARSRWTRRACWSASTAPPRSMPSMEDVDHFTVNVLHRDQARGRAHLRRPQAAGAALRRRLGAMTASAPPRLRDAQAVDPLPPHRSSPVRHPFDLHRRGRGGGDARRDRSAGLSRRPLRRWSAARPDANSLAGSAIALISSALPLGSRKNIVACSPDLALEADLRRDDELRCRPRSAASASASQSAIGSTAPKCGTGTWSPSTGLRVRAAATLRRIEMGDDLVAEEIEIDPAFGMAPLRAAEHAAVESAGRLQIVDREGEVEGRQHAVMRRFLVAPERKARAMLRRPVARRRGARRLAAARLP